jgi:PAS domain S-box-containing protein
MRSPEDSALEASRVPRPLIVALVVLAAVPYVLAGTNALSLESARTGRQVHGLLEWTTICVTVFTSVLGLLYLRVRRDLIVWTLTLASLASGAWDAVHALASLGLIPSGASVEDVIPWSCAVSRTLKALVLAAGPAYLLLGGERYPRLRWMWFLAGSASAGAAAFGYWSLSLGGPIPAVQFPEAIVTRPWDLLSLGLFLVAAAFLYPLLVRRQPSLLAKALLAAVVLDSLASAHIAFGSSTLYDRDFLIAHLLKLAASIVPLSGICLHLVNSYRRERTTAESMERLVNELRATENELRSKEVRMDQLTQTIREVFWIVTPGDAMVHYVSPAYEEIFGLSCESLYRKGDSFLTVVHPEDRPMMIDLLSSVPEKDFEVEYRIVRPDGEVRWLRTRGFIIRRGGTERHRLAGVTEDVTERKRAEEGLQKSETRTRALLQAMPDLMFRVNRAGFILDYYAQPSARLYRMPTSLLGARAAEVFPELSDRFLARVADALQTGTVASYEYHVESRGEVADYEARFASTADDEVLVVVRDITESYRLQKEILDISRREQERISHDLHDGISQQLTGIALLCKVLEQQLAARSIPEAERARQIEVLVADALHQTKILARGLAPVELEAGDLSAALESLAVSAETIHRVSCTFKSSRETVSVDRASAIHVYRIAQEAVSNALRHGSPTRIAIDLSESDGRFLLTIRDDGRGFAPDADGSRGSGMGLHIMSYRARMIDGALEVGPARSGGTLVRCEWPRVSASAHASLPRSLRAG